MQTIIENMIRDFERGRLTRRQLAASLAALVSSRQASEVFDLKPTSTPPRDSVKSGAWRASRN